MGRREYSLKYLPESDVCDSYVRVPTSMLEERAQSFVQSPHGSFSGGQWQRLCSSDPSIHVCTTTI